MTNADLIMLMGVLLILSAFESKLLAFLTAVLIGIAYIMIEVII